VKIIDIDLQRRRISLSIKQAAEGGEVSEEYREAFGEHAYDEQGNYIGFDYAATEFHARDRSSGGVVRVRGRARQPARGGRVARRCRAARRSGGGRRPCGRSGA